MYRVSCKIVEIRRVLVLVVVSIFVSVSSSWADNQPDKGFFGDIMHLYSTVVSPVDGDRCPMYPTCSGYAQSAVDKHGFFRGWVMTLDRLLRCGGDELDLSETVFIHHEKRCYDPVSENDFWWTDSSRPASDADRSLLWVDE